VSESFDALIVGGGVMGAIVAAQIRADRPDASILMVDAGPPAGSAVGHHLHDTPDDDARTEYSDRARGANQERYVRRAGQAASSDLSDIPAGMRTLAEFGNDVDQMPGASIGWNAGGMSVHWAAATPTPFGAEIPAEIDRAEWDADLAAARAYLRVHDDPYPHDPIGRAVLDVFEEVFGPASAPGRHPQPMPVAMHPDGHGRLERTGPSAVFPPISAGGDPGFELRHSTIVERILHEDGRAVGAELRSIDGATRDVVHAEVVVVCADTFRTPQLLFASGLGGSAVGRYLNEHAFLAGTVLVDLDRLGVDTPARHLDDEWFTSASWLPHSDVAQPFQGQIMQTPVLDEERPGFAVTIALYVPTEVRAENRVEFSATDSDIAGLPRMRVHFGYTAYDSALIDRARAEQAHVAARLGRFDADQPSTLLPAGSSLHYTGTARLGARDDGTSVCDPDGRVWGARGVFVAGNAVIPTALVANSTLAGAVTAVRAGRAAARMLDK